MKKVVESAAKKVKETAKEKAEDLFAKITGEPVKSKEMKKALIEPVEDLASGEISINKNPKTGEYLPGKDPKL